jgi:ATP-dependent Clp protease ATP-binding subunit ClpC
VTALSLARDRARATGAAGVTTGHLLQGLLAEGGNLALQILAATDLEPGTIVLPEPLEAEPGGGEGLRFSTPAAAAIELAVSEATALGHNYVGCEHLLIGLVAEPEGTAGRVLRGRGAEAKATRRAVAAAAAGYAHLRSNAGAPAAATGILTAVRAELQPLIQRIERLEQRQN